MELDEDLKVILRSLDQMVGHAWKDLAVGFDPPRDKVLIYATCRVCKAKHGADNVNTAPGWGRRLVDKFLAELKKHDEQHTIILPTRGIH